MLDIKPKFIDLMHSYPNKIAIIILIITNFICNNIFLFNLKYYSDDWPLLVYPGHISFSNAIQKAILDSQRPLSNVIFVLGQQIADNVILFHLLAFITTTIALILVYFIFRKIFRDFEYKDDFYPFMSAMLFCTLFNKDEVYSFPTISFGFAYITYILTIYLYLNKEKKYYFSLSLFVYFLALLSSEIGIIIPVFLLLYDYIIGKNWKKSLFFFVPLTLYLVIRFTHWFGYGVAGPRVGFGTYNLELIIISFRSLIITAYVFLNNLINSAYGYAQMGIMLIVFLLVINVVLLFIIYKYLINLKVSDKFNIKLIYVAFLMIIVFIAPYIIRGGMVVETRAFYLLDIGITLLLVCVLMLLRKYLNIKILTMLLIVLGIFVNQGLYYNWVVSGNIQEKIDNFIEENKDELLKYDYVYFNTRSFTEHMPNKYEMESLPFYSTFKGIRYQLFGSPPELISNRQYDNGYGQYYNAWALHRWSLESMISERKKTNYTLIYGNYYYYGTVPIDVTKDTITYKNQETGPNFTVSRDKVFEINYSSVVSFDRLHSAM